MVKTQIDDLKDVGNNQPLNHSTWLHMIQTALIKQIHSNDLQRIIRYFLFIDQNR